MSKLSRRGFMKVLATVPLVAIACKLPHVESKKELDMNKPELEIYDEGRYVRWRFTKEMEGDCIVTFPFPIPKGLK